MEDYPKTMLEFNKRFITEHSCQEYLYKMRWPEGFICPHCQHREYWMMRRGQSQQYRCKRCRSWISATAGTIFQDTHIHVSMKIRHFINEFSVFPHRIFPV